MIINFSMKNFLIFFYKSYEKILFIVFRKLYEKKFPDSIIFPWVFIDDSCVLGKNTVIHRNAHLNNTSLGDYTYTYSTITNATVGKFCSISPDCIFGLPNHPTRKIVSTHPAFFSKSNSGCLESFSEKNLFEEKPERIQIGNDVWIGWNCIIMGGISIGNGAIIGAGAVVTKDVEDYAVVGGVPAKLIRYRFTKEQIEYLNKIKWWDMDIEWIRKNCEIFLDIEKFCSAKFNHSNKI
jgi:acetyltransferase-like isoleucine patch superfamily enzyme